MPKTDEGPATAVEIKTVMADFCTTAREVGQPVAERTATVHLVAAAAYLEETVGPARTMRILSATIAAIESEIASKH